MKAALFLTSVVLSIITCGASPAPECSWGPSYWCQSKVTAVQCGQEAYCNNQVWKATVKAYTKVGTVQCDVCKLVIGKVKELISSNATEQEVENALKDVCSDLGSLKDECDLLLTKYFPDIWQMIVNQADPTTICTAADICTSLVAEAKAETEVKVGTVQCDVCELVIGLVQKMVNSNSTEQDVEDALKKVCSVLDSLKDECDTLLTTFFPQIWQLIVNEMDPKAVCAEIKLCSSTMLQAKVANVGTVQCDVCKLVAQFLKQFVGKNTTEAEVQQELEQLCSMLGSLKDECDTLLTDYFPQIWNMIVNELDPSTVCSAIGLCTSKEIAKPLNLFKLRIGGHCTVCKKVVEALQKLVLSNTAEDVAEDEVKKVCIYLGPLDFVCKDVIDKYFPKMWQLLQQELSAGEVCEELQLCSSRKETVAASQSVAPVKSAECDYCKIIANYLNKFIASNGTEEEAKQEVKNLCSMMGSASGECNSVVDLFFDQIWKMLVEETEPDVICNLLKLCTNSVKDAGLACNDIGVCKSKATPLQSPKHKVAPPKKQNPCDLCKLLVTFLKPYVDSNSTENEVESALEHLCDFLPGSIKGECTTFIDNYFATIWGLLKMEFESDQICQQIGLCNSTSTMARIKKPAPKSRAALPKQSACDICKLVVTFLSPYVDSNTTENEVKQALEGLCNILPSGLKTECTSLVDQNFDTIWSLVKSEFDNDLICKQIGLCNSTLSLLKHPASPRPRVAMPRQSACDLCKMVVSLIKPYADSNATESKVKEVLTEFCNMLPANCTSECSTFVSDFFPTIWQMVVGELNNDEICNVLKLCNSTSSTTKDAEVLGFTFDHPLPVGESPLCAICTTVSAYIREFVENNVTEKDAKKAVTELCNKIPSPYNSSCLTLVGTYFDMIWSLIDSYVEDDDLCKKLLQCNSSAATQELKEELSGPLCVICEFVMKELDSMLDSNTTEAEIKAALDKVCSILPKSVQTDCDSFVSTYGDDIIKLLLEAVSPKLICAALHLCTANEVVVMPVVEIAGLKDECSTCKVVLGFVKTLVEDYNKPIEQALEDVCGLMPSTIKSECTTFVKEFGPEIIQLVDQELDPEQICKDLNLCTGSALMAPWKKLARAKSS